MSIVYKIKRILIRLKCIFIINSKKKVRRVLFKKLNRKVIAIVDPIRIFSHYLGARYFFLFGIQIYHITYIRKNINKKIQNSNARNYIQMILNFRKILTFV